MRSLAEEIWVHEEPLRFYGLQVGRRMVVVRLADGSLWINSPAPLGDVRADLEAIGEPRFVTPASTLHGHLFMEQYAAAFPDVELFAVPGLERKRPELHFAGKLDDGPDPRWEAEIDQVALTGFKHLIERELVFLHRRSRTLILGDLAFYIGDDWPLATRIFARVMGVRNRLAPTRDFRHAVKDRRAARPALERIAEWDFDRVVVGHGDVVETGGHHAFVAGVSNVLA